MAVTLLWPSGTEIAASARSAYTSVRHPSQHVLEMWAYLGGGGFEASSSQVSPAAFLHVAP